jgi:hypothetical protein
VKVLDCGQGRRPRTVRNVDIATRTAKISEFRVTEFVCARNVPNHEFVGDAQCGKINLFGVNFYANGTQLRFRKRICYKALDDTGFPDGEVTDDTHLACHEGHG